VTRARRTPPLGPDARAAQEPEARSLFSSTAC